MQKVSNQPYKGTADWYGREMQVRRYIFDTWRNVCEQFGYAEYLTPLIENEQIYNKSGEDAGDKELARLTDKAGRKLAIRPEMTPSVTRLVSKIYKQSPKPLRLYSIANFMRMEKPQRGRNREFWQLNFDIFGDDSLGADLEILIMAIEIMKAFDAPKDSFKLYLNNRFLMDDLLAKVLQIKSGQKKQQLIRWVDKYDKVSADKFVAGLEDMGLDKQQTQYLQNFMDLNMNKPDTASLELYKDSKGYQDTFSLIQELRDLGYGDYVEFRPQLARGFDYYDGMVFEVFDQNPENNRSMFGGGRYNGLAGMFGSEDFPAVGCAPGDETTTLFLEGWNLLPEEMKPIDVFIPQIIVDNKKTYYKLVQKLRRSGFSVELSTKTMSISNALKYANQKEIKQVVIIAEDELKNNQVQLKNMQSGEQEQLSTDQLVSRLVRKSK